MNAIIMKSIKYFFLFFKYFSFEANNTPTGIITKIYTRGGLTRIGRKNVGIIIKHNEINK
jgi:hypothetical protein